MDTIRLPPSERSLAAKVCTRAFFDYPMITFDWPDPNRRARYLDWLWVCAINYGFRYGVVYTTPGIDGVAVWLPPGQTHVTTWRYALVGYLQLPFFMGFKQFFTRSMKRDDLEQKMREEIIPGPHWYLWILAVDPVRQGKGVGTILMRTGLKSADAHHLPCYLETYDEKNIIFYQKQGFNLIRTVQVPDSKLSFWCFLREPHKT